MRDFGSSHAEKSKLLHGITQEMMVTFGSAVSIDAAAVERFRLALVQSKQARLLRLVSPEASVIIKDEKLSKSLLAIYSQCEVIKPRVPSLAVREKAA